MAVAKEQTSKPGTPKVQTPWGKASVVDEVVLAQRVGEGRFATHVQLLEGPKRERLVRFAYATDGSARRGPVTLDAGDLKRLRSSLAKHPALADALGMGGGA